LGVNWEAPRRTHGANHEPARLRSVCWGRFGVSTWRRRTAGRPRSDATATHGTCPGGGAGSDRLRVVASTGVGDATVSPASSPSWRSGRCGESVHARRSPWLRGCRRRAFRGYGRVAVDAARDSGRETRRAIEWTDWRALAQASDLNRPKVRARRLRDRRAGHRSRSPTNMRSGSPHPRARASVPAGLWSHA
jgi:hypothetical protein